MYGVRGFMIAQTSRPTRVSGVCVCLGVDKAQHKLAIFFLRITATWLDRMRYLAEITAGLAYGVIVSHRIMK